MDNKEVFSIRFCSPPKRPHEGSVEAPLTSQAVAAVDPDQIPTCKQRNGIWVLAHGGLAVAAALLDSEDGAALRMRTILWTVCVANGDALPVRALLFIRFTLLRQRSEQSARGV